MYMVILITIIIEVFNGNYTRDYIIKCSEKKNLFPYIQSVIPLALKKYKIQQLQVILY